MQGTRVASRYAKSLLQLSLEQGVLEKVSADMKLVAECIDANKDLELLLKSPIIKTDKKIAILNDVFGEKVTPITNAFLNIITNKKREIYLLEIANSFNSQYKLHKKVLTAVITTAQGIDDDTRNKVMALVKNNSESEVELVEKNDPSLIGGFVLRVGDKQVDTSIARQLKNMKRTFSENPYVKEY